MSIRDDLAEVIYGERAVSLRTGYAEIDMEFARDAADAVLAYLGDLDRDADAELIALHLRDTRAELERLRAQHVTLVEVVEERRRIYRQCADLANNFESKAWNDGAATAMTWLLQELSALKKEEGDPE